MSFDPRAGAQIPFLDRMGLEMSLKSFGDWSEETVQATAEALFDQWRPLLGAAESCAVLLWIADGSEILEWAGVWEEEVEWANKVGFSNTEWNPYGNNVTADRVGVPYREDVPALRYADVKRIVAVLRAVGEERLGIPVMVGATFDPGPEFAQSEFKYERHPEIVAPGEASGIGKMIQMVRASATLRGDDRRYAAYPDGIPDGT